MAQVARIHAQGGPEVLQIEDIEIGEPGPGEVRLRVEAVGLNRAEAMYRAGRYPVPCELPSRMGYEGVGTVEALGPGVEGFEAGQRVCVLPMTTPALGLWAEQAIVPVRALLPAPPEQLLGPETLADELDLADIADGDLPHFLSEQRPPKSAAREQAEAWAAQEERGKAAWEKMERKEGELGRAEFADMCRYLDPAGRAERSRRRYR